MRCAHDACASSRHPHVVALPLCIHPLLAFLHTSKESACSCLHRRCVDIGNIGNMERSNADGDRCINSLLVNVLTKGQGGAILPMEGTNL